MIISEERERLVLESIKQTVEIVHNIIPKIRNYKPEKDQWIYDYLESIYRFEIPNVFESGRDLDHTLLNMGIELAKNNRELDKFLFCPDRVSEAFLYMSSYTIITKPWIKDMASILKGKKVLEVACGTGMLAKGLRDEGIDVIATNKTINIEDEYSVFVNRLWIDDIERIDAVEAVYKYGRDIDYIILSWPPYQGQLDLEVLNAMRKTNPNCTLIIIGEEMGGCTGSMKFFDTARSANSNESWIIANRKFKNRMGVHDYVQFYK